jgi:hypothetical protein
MIRLDGSYLLDLKIVGDVPGRKLALPGCSLDGLKLGRIAQGRHIVAIGVLDWDRARSAQRLIWPEWSGG